jgi:single-strand DNA-binding protein
MNPTNRVQLTGNLAKDPEIKSFENGGKLARFSMATNEEYTTRKGEKSTDTQWHFISAWGKVAEHVEAELKKGSFVSVDGRLVTRNYTDKSGQKKYITEIVANEVTLNQKAA